YAFRYGSRRGEQQAHPGDEQQRSSPNKQGFSADDAGRPRADPRGPAVGPAPTIRYKPSGSRQIGTALLGLAGAIASGWVLGKLTEPSRRRTKSVPKPPLWRRPNRAQSLGARHEIYRGTDNPLP